MIIYVCKLYLEGNPGGLFYTEKAGPSGQYGIFDGPGQCQMTLPWGFMSKYTNSKQPSSKLANFLWR